MARCNQGRRNIYDAPGHEKKAPEVQRYGKHGEHPFPCNLHVSNPKITSKPGPRLRLSLIPSVELVADGSQHGLHEPIAPREAAASACLLENSLKLSLKQPY